MEEAAQVPRDVALGAADEGDLGQALEDTVGDRAGTTERVELALVLDRAQLLDDAARRHELESALGERLPARVGQVGRLEADAA